MIIRNILYLIGLAIVAVFCNSCYILTPVEPEIISEQQGLVMHGFLNENDSIEIYLHEVNGVAEDGYTTIPDAQVNLFQNDELIDVLEWNRSSYRSQVKPQKGFNYKVAVNYPSIGTIDATTALPTTINIDSIQWNATAGVSPWGDNYSEITLYFTDPAEEQNYYQIFPYCFSDNEYWNDILFEYTINDPVLSNSGCLEYNNNDLYFTDDLVNGQSYAMKFHVMVNSFINDPNFKLYVLFNSISESMYDYIKSSAAHIQNQGALQLELLIISGNNPVFVNSSVNGGYGVLGAYGQQKILVETGK